MRTRFQRKAPVAFQPQNVVLSAFSRMKNHSDPASHALLNYPLRPLIFSGSPPRILRIVLAQPRRLPQPARTSAFQTSFGDGCDISTRRKVCTNGGTVTGRRKVCTNGCTVTGDSVSEDFPISPPPSVGAVPIHTSGGRISASAGAQFPVRAPERTGAGPSSTKDGRQSWKTASPR